MTTKTAGQQLAATLRRLERIGTRTRRYRGRLSVVERMLEHIQLATTLPGYHTGETHTVLARAGAVYRAWVKHVEGYRIRPELHAQISKMSPWQTAKFLGQMVDAGITNSGEAEIWFGQIKVN